MDNTNFRQLLEEHLDMDAKMYQYLMEKAEEILIDYYEGRENISLPIDIRGIVESYNISIAEMKLNFDGDFEQRNGHLRYKTHNDIIIYVDYDESEFSKRYYLAYFFSKYILNNSNMLTNGISNQEVKFSVNTYADACNIMSCFLMMPYWLVLDNIKKYYEGMDKAIFSGSNPDKPWALMCADCTRNLSNKSNLSFIHIIQMDYVIKKFMMLLYTGKINVEDRESILQKYKCLFY